MKVNDMTSVIISAILMMSGLVLGRTGAVSLTVSLVLMLLAIILLFYAILPRGKKRK